MIVRRLKTFSRFSFYYYETLLSSVSSTQKELNDNYANNIALFINDYLELLKSQASPTLYESANNQIIFLDWFQEFEY